MASKVKNGEWREIDGILCLVVSDSNGHSIAIPAQGLQTLAGEARRRLTVNPSSSGQVWSPAQLLSVQTWNVGTTDSGTVALILDRGLDTEIQYSLPIEHARGLAELLSQESDVAARISKSRN